MGGGIYGCSPNEQEQAAKRQKIVDLKESIFHLLLGWRVPTSVSTLKRSMGMAGLCQHYPELNDPINELLWERRITLQFSEEGELYFSANY